MEVHKGNLESQLKWPLRPVLTSLNGDTSWLFSFPRPRTDIGSKFFYHVVFEPWLTGSATQLNSSLVHVSPSERPKVTDAKQVDRIVREIEKAASNAAKAHNLKRPQQTRANPAVVDAVLLFCHYFDHTHEPTLRGFDKRIPVIATRCAKARVDHWNHFETVSLVPEFPSSAKTWQTPELQPDALPSWLNTIYIPGLTGQYLLGAIIWTNESGIHETVFVCHHGAKLQDEPFQALLNSHPRLEKLALMHPLKEVRAPFIVDFAGAEGGLALYRRIGEPKYWVVYHDLKTNYAGLVMRLIRIQETPRTLEWALKREIQSKMSRGEGQHEIPTLVKVDNGRCFILS